MARTVKTTQSQPRKGSAATDVRMASSDFAWEMDNEEEN